jgi:hypothetical protein
MQATMLKKKRLEKFVRFAFEKRKFMEFLKRLSFNQFVVSIHEKKKIRFFLVLANKHNKIKVN